MRQFITTLEDLAQAPPRRLLLLYSGGVDGSYLLWWLHRHGIPVSTLRVGIGAGLGRVGEGDLAARHAAAFGAEHHEVDATDEFFTDFVPVAIHADAYYQGQFPVGSTLSRPLMARVAVRLAGELGCDIIGHTATYLQNSALRITGSIAALDPDLGVAAPFLGSHVPREVKVAALRDAGITFATGIHSIDVNPWARVIECGSLESPENVLDESVFTWTRAVADCPAEPAELALAFAGGLPVAVDSAPVKLADLVTRLNTLGGSHGIGRFSGLEDTSFGVKNHEIREAPAATVLTIAHRALGNAVLTTREHAVRAGLAQEWTNVVVQGGWFGHLGRCLAGCLAELDQPLTGTVWLRLSRGTVTVTRLASPHGLYYTRLGEGFHTGMSAYSYAPWLAQATLVDHVRNGGYR